MGEYKPWNESWGDRIVYTMLPYQVEAPVVMPSNFYYPIFLEDLLKGFQGENFWRSIAGAMVYVMGHQPNHPQVQSYVNWLKEFNPTLFTELVYNGVENVTEGRLDTALWLLQAAVLINPDMPEIHYNLAVVYTELGRNLHKEEKIEDGDSCFEQADQYMENALRLEPHLIRRI